MKKNSIARMVIVLMAISLVSGAILTLANEKFSPIIKARESDKMRIVAEKLLPEGSQITKVTNYKELKSLVESVRQENGLNAEWKWDPDAKPLESVAKAESKDEPEVDIDWSAWGLEGLDEEEITPPEEETVTEPEVEEFNWADFGIEVDDVSVGSEEEPDADASDDLDLEALFAADVDVNTKTTNDTSESSDDYDLDSLFATEVDVSKPEESALGTSDEPAAEKTPAFEIYQAVSGGKLVGVAVISKAKGYGGDIVIMLALDGTLERVLGIDVLQQSETAGLGSLITGEKFTSQFTGKAVGNPYEVGKDIQGVAGATISSKGVASALQKALKNLEQFLIDGTVKEGA